MNSRPETTPEPEVTCSNCAAACCRQQAMLFDDSGIPDQFVVTDSRGVASMARLADGWCVALDRATMACTIYPQRPWICREFELGKEECLAAQAADYGCPER